ncbi:MAG: 30S ribosome-binding factor RbfA [Candidatus Phytoplasma stylosanthis]|uniref:30S ribosome-binding factor RbfA n=1 Tax=Candidatus Phytoplasma stylosanthis TaxID=2798314 RepID=UPI00293A7582|nr:30S ribosome-binding factor RbfA [Candidatus Phytoplasma stylosanthis]MDV3168136.1 30S ribosome-binding factor RbfA [Candidatus Phytoplasma stylosanthis]MDV3170825.1 30S ribosome-binding factor RbfA [Candidatus Phytoplasma stylosanthis]MDV3173749.1 30S ribosome-binding factor RbfA [Candidatus Phytoplasma stylosanthis]MDV3174161.1 30S ribosome-binding factor RbfA [Candidatus Phytoplasma stylosanthis]MDV3202547.1 30S ribosome-binding factor RbfA [Candidatus Phytoplasma stylosanthis]
MNDISNKRRASLIHESLVNIVNNVIKNEKIGYINLTGVDLSNDLSFCKVYFTILNDRTENINESFKILEKNKKTIRMKLASEIQNMKKIPDLIFKYDKSLTYGKKIDKLLDNIIK